MKLLIFLSITFSLLFSETKLEEAERLKQDPKSQAKAQDLFLQLSLEGSSYADVELGKLFIYGEGVPQDCQKGILYLLNGATAKNPNYEGFKEISYLFKEGICVKKDEIKSEKYIRMYNEKIK